MMDLIQDQISYISLYDDSTKIKYFSSKPRYIIAYVLYLGYVEIDHTLTEQSGLGRLPQSLIRNDKYRKIPANPVIKKQQATEGEAAKRDIEPHQLPWPDERRQASDNKRYEEEIKPLSHRDDMTPKYEDNCLVFVLPVELLHDTIIQRKHSYK